MRMKKVFLQKESTYMGQLNRVRQWTRRDYSAEGGQEHQKLVQPGRKGSVDHRITEPYWNKDRVYKKDTPKWISVPEWAQKEWWAM